MPLLWVGRQTCNLALFAPSVQPYGGSLMGQHCLDSEITGVNETGMEPAGMQRIPGVGWGRAAWGDEEATNQMG